MGIDASDALELARRLLDEAQELELPVREISFDGSRVTAKLGFSPVEWAKLQCEKLANGDHVFPLKHDERKLAVKLLRRLNERTLSRPLTNRAPKANRCS